MELSAGVVGVALILIGIALIAFEATVPGFGGPGAVGIVSTVAGVLVLLDANDVLELPRALVVALVVLAAIFVPIATILAIRAKRAPVHVPPDIVGASGVALTVLDPYGTVNVHSEEWSAEAEGGPIEVGAKIEVVGEHGLKLRVRQTGK